MNPAFFSDNTALLALLERWAEHGWLRALDVAFASFLARETPDAVLSDDDIVDALHKGGVELARRTVAKYREAMNIPSSVQRRREKRALAKASGG